MEYMLMVQEILEGIEERGRKKKQKNPPKNTVILGSLAPDI